MTEEEAEQRNNAAVPASQHTEDLSGILERPLMAFVQEFRFRPPPVYCEVSHQLLETTSTYTQGSLSLIGIYKGLERSLFCTYVSGCRQNVSQGWRFCSEKCLFSLHLMFLYFHFLPSGWPQPSALKHETSLHDMLNYEPWLSVKRPNLKKRIKRFLFSWITALWWWHLIPPSVVERDWSATESSGDGAHRNWMCVEDFVSRP